jgi:hypothetical protein
MPDPSSDPESEFWLFGYGFEIPTADFAPPSLTAFSAQKEV